MGQASSDSSYRHNHYVPEWYQKRFLPPGSSKQFYLDLRPETVSSNGHRFTRNELMNWGPRRCFAQDDLYTSNWRGIESREMEKRFFGRIDSRGQSAVGRFADFTFGSHSATAFEDLLLYMSVQKLRTPKGLIWLDRASGSRSRNATLSFLERIRNIFCAIWTECVWQIADASHSPTKFIISDHPVVVYNRECFPASKWCLGVNDPDIRQVATHTYFPLSPEKILILTNLSWVRDPYQSALKFRPNPNFFRSAMFSFMDIHVERYLTEEEVLEINYITKRRAFRYIAAPEKDWLYPERHLRSDHWRKLGDGYLLMPDPRHVHGGGSVIIGYESGASDAFSEYGHKPWEEGYEDSDRENHEWAAMQRFKAEWAATYGPDYRGVVHTAGSRPTRYAMSQSYYEDERDRDKEYAKRPGERARRRHLKRPQKAR